MLSYFTETFLDACALKFKSQRAPDDFGGERPLMGVCLKTMTVIGILSLSSRSASHISVSIIALTQMIRCAEARTDVEPEWLNHKVTQMKELIGLAIMMCVKWAPWSLWHWSIRILLKFACDSLIHCSDSCFMGVDIHTERGYYTGQIWLAHVNCYLPEEWVRIRDGCQGKKRDLEFESSLLRSAVYNGDCVQWAFVWNVGPNGVMMA